MARSKKNTDYLDEWNRFVLPDLSDMTPVADLRVGQSFRFRGRHYTIEEKAECVMLWRSHVHINKSNCFDGRTLVRVH